MALVVTGHGMEDANTKDVRTAEVGRAPRIQEIVTP